MTREVLELSWSEGNIYDTNCIDFDDQIWLTVCKRPNGLPITQPVYDIIFIDECQDLNITNIEMIKMVLKPNGIVIGVGDKNQSIYKFRGADTHAMEKMETSFNAKNYPLSITYRCSQEVTAHAQELVPNIQCAPTAVKGEAPIITNEYGANIFKGGDMVLCRNNGPLLDLAYKLIKAKIPVYVKGRDIGDKLITLINDCVGVKKWAKVNGRNVPTISIEAINTVQLHRALMQWKNTQIDVIRRDDPDNEGAVQSVLDRVDSIMVFIGSNTDNKVSTIVEQIESMFKDKSVGDMVTFSSIHKAKGMEADRVFMYAKECLYPWWVKRGTDDYQQEVNIDYVARTRAKTSYTYLSTKGWVDQ
jgi:superfamily I DNA/RNA helicase